MLFFLGLLLKKKIYIYKTVALLKANLLIFAYAVLDVYKISAPI